MSKEKEAVGNICIRLRFEAFGFWTRIRMLGTAIAHIDELMKFVCSG